jgi:glycosyltransferase involved in cell wall biosynthesis
VPFISRESVSVVIPVYRNAATLPELHRRLRAVSDCSPEPFELVFVDDASPDDSLTALRRLALVDQRMVVIALPHNVGQQRALLAGLARSRSATVVIMDADLQDSPELIPSLISALDGRVAAAFLGRRGCHQPITRRFTSRVFKTLLHWLCGTPPDAGLFAALDRPMVNELLRYDPPGPSMLAMIGCTGLPLTSLPLPRVPRAGGRSAYSGWNRLALGFRALVWVLARRRMVSR